MLEWQLEHGEILPFLLQLHEEGFDVPELSEHPQLDRAQQWYLQAFHTLSRSRKHGMAGPQPLSIGAMKDYIQMKGIRCSGERERFLRYMQTLDSTFLEHHRESD